MVFISRREIRIVRMSFSQEQHPRPLESHSFVGIFWAVQGKGLAVVLLDHRCPLKDAEPYGDMLTCSHGHYEVWEEWRKSARIDPPGTPGTAKFIATDEYEEWPRGRIVYSRPCGHFILYADAQILSRPDLLMAVHERFGLPANRTENKRDSHYISTRRLDR